MLPVPRRASVVALARDWIGTPYRHQASCIGVGCDCIGFVRGLYRALYARDPGSLPDYTPDWAEATGCEQLLDAARLHLVEIDIPACNSGDILIFRYRRRLIAKHAAVVAATHCDGPTLIHAMEGVGVVEVPFSPWWRRRVAAAFSFPGITD